MTSIAQPARPHLHDASRQRVATAEFEYLAEKVLAAPFEGEPFDHLLIDDFLREDHLDLLTRHPQIALPEAASIEALLETLSRAGYAAVPFPGCTDDVDHYLECLNNNHFPRQKPNKPAAEGFGVAMRLMRYRDARVEALLGYLNGPTFKRALERKFGIERPNRIETAIQKYLSGYEISPHPDVRSKCLTYLLNVHTTPEAQPAPIHTHLLRFESDKAFIYDLWEGSPRIERCWVPWDWCRSVKQVRANNQIVLFQPHARSLHAVKLQYDHTRFQRTQIYGNLWYTDCNDVRLEDCQHERLLDRRTRVAPSPSHHEEP